LTYEIISTRKRKALQIKQPRDLYTVIRRYAFCKQEQFIIITLNAAHEIIGIHIATIGLANQTIITPREIFYHAIKDFACALFVAHNHPSGILEPSPQDIEINERILKSAQILGIHYLDNLIIGKNGFYSFREHGHEFYEK